jgi:hypothetical protein
LNVGQLNQNAQSTKTAKAAGGVRTHGLRMSPLAISYKCVALPLGHYGSNRNKGLTADYKHYIQCRKPIPEQATDSSSMMHAHGLSRVSTALL